MFLLYFYSFILNIYDIKAKFNLNEKLWLLHPQYFGYLMLFFIYIVLFYF